MSFTDHVIARSCMVNVIHRSYNLAVRIKSSVLFALPFVAFLSALLQGCGGSSVGAGTTTSPVVPAISSIAPNTIGAGAPTTLLTVMGSNFLPTSAIQVGGTTLPTTYVSATQLTANVPASQLAAGALLQVAVLNGSTSSPGGTGSSLEVDNPAPQIQQLSPAALVAGSGATSLQVTGMGFLPTTTITVNGSARATTYISATQVSVLLTAADLATAASLSVVATNPSPGGGTWAGISLAVDNLSPTITAVSPHAVLAGTTTPITVTVNGTNFIRAATTVTVNTVPHAVTSLSPTQLTFALTAAEQANAGALSVQISNAAPGGGNSSAVVIQVNTPTPSPVISSILPARIVARGGNVSVDVSGQYLNANCTLLWNGAGLDTTFSVTVIPPRFTLQHLSAKVPDTLFASVGSAAVTASCPSALQSLSNAVNVSITNELPPTITGIAPAAIPIRADAEITIQGEGFTNNSVASYNGVAIVTTFQSQTSLTATVPATLLPTSGNGDITAATPAPGGLSHPITLTSYLPVVSNNMVFNPVNGLAYVSVPGSGSTLQANSVVSFDPATGVFGTPIPVGIEPGVMAVSGDGTTLWVALNGSPAIQKVDLVNAVAGTQYPVGNLAVPGAAITAIVVLPGTTNSVAIAGGTQLGIYDAGHLRGNLVNVTQVYGLQADGNRSELYAGGNGLQAYTYDSSGLVLKSAGSFQTNVTAPGLDDLQLANGRVFTDTGRVYDSESGDVLGTLLLGVVPAYVDPALYDAGLSHIYVLNSLSAYNYTGGYSHLSLYSPVDYTSTGQFFSWNIPPSIKDATGKDVAIQPHRLTRWGSNGLLLHTTAALFAVQSNVIQ